MQLSIELLPAPLGPMMARISCSRTSNEMSVSALTPPKRRLRFWMSRMTSPMGWVRMRFLRTASGGRFGRGKGLGVEQLERGAQVAGVAIFELDLGGDELFAAARIERLDQHAVLLGNEAAPHLARARELVVI